MKKIKIIKVKVLIQSHDRKIRPDHMVDNSICIE